MGDKLRVYDERLGYIPHHKIFAWCAISQMRRGHSIAVPFDAPRILDEHASRLNVRKSSRNVVSGAASVAPSVRAAPSSIGGTATNRFVKRILRRSPPSNRHPSKGIPFWSTVSGSRFVRVARRLITRRTTLSTSRRFATSRESTGMRTAWFVPFGMPRSGASSRVANSPSNPDTSMKRGGRTSRHFGGKRSR